MPNPSRSQVNPVNIPLTMLSAKYLQEESNFVCDSVFPPVMVPLSTGSYYVFSKDDFMRDEMEERAPGTQVKKTGYNISTTPYMCKPYGLGHDIPDQVRGDASPPVDLERSATQMLTEKYMIKKEKLWASSYFQAGIWAGAPDGIAWNWSVATADPISDVLTLSDAVKGNSGIRPNTLVLGQQAFRMATQSATVLDRVKYTSRGQITKDIFGSLLSDSGNTPIKVLVLEGVENTAAEGQAGTIANIGDGASALLCYSAPGPSIDRPSAGYQFIWDSYPGGMGPVIKSYREEALAAQVVELNASVDFAVTGADLGAFQSQITA